MPLAPATTRPSDRPTPRITGPGLAEIKPHHPRAIREGLGQLHARLRGPYTRHPDYWLLTYRAQPAGADRPSSVRIVAHRIDPQALGRLGPAGDRSRLITATTEFDAPLPPVIRFPPTSQPAMFGMAVEDVVRSAFGKRFRRVADRALPAGGNRPGPDVLWKELAEFYRELAAETGDGYWSALADELAAES